MKTVISNQWNINQIRCRKMGQRPALGARARAFVFTSPLLLAVKVLVVLIKEITVSGDAEKLGKSSQRVEPLLLFMGFHRKLLLLHHCGV